MPNWLASTSSSAQSVNGALQRFSTALSAVPAGKVRYGLLVLTGVWLVSLLADIFWMMFPVPATKAGSAATEIVVPVTSGNQSPQVDVSTMQSWNLFGSRSVQDTSSLQEQVDTSAASFDEAALTSLQLVLLGALQSDIPEESYAIIRIGEKSELIKVGENIPVGDGISLAKVLVDRVIINNRGRMESLLLYAEGESRPVQVPQVSGGKKVLDQRNNPELTMMADNYRNQLMTNPMSLTDVIKISIAKDGEGKIMGYRVRPGRDRAQFAKFGLQTGDIVTAINGISLDDPAKAMELYGQLREAKEASFVVKRGNEELNLIVGLSQ